MRVVFMGTSDFAVPTLHALLREHEVLAAYSRPDRPSGRGRRMIPTPVRVAALESGVPVRQPERLGDPDEVALLTGDRPDAIVVAAFGAILPAQVLAIPAYGCLNVHASLLPRWRGAAPIQRAILAGDEVTGVCVMRMEVGLDTGPWCARATVGIGEKDAGELGAELAVLGGKILVGALPHLRDGSLQWTRQDDSRATYASKVTSADVAISPDLRARDVLARVRAASASAPCRVILGGRALTVLRASLAPERVAPGRARCVRHPDLGCVDGAVRLDEVVPEGRAPMVGDAFIRGAHMDAECEWGPR